MDFGSAVLRPDKSEAFDVFEDIEKRMMDANSEPGRNIPLIFAANDATTLRQSIITAQSVLKTDEVESNMLPLALVPDAEAQKANLTRCKPSPNVKTNSARLWMPPDSPRWRSRSRRTSSNSGANGPLPIHAAAVAETRRAGKPRRHRFQARGTRLDGAGLRPPRRRPRLEKAAVLHALEKIPGAHPAGWAFLRTSLEPLLKREILRVCVPTAAIAILLFFLVFHGWRERGFAFLVLAASGWILLGGMSAFGLTWNLMSVGAVPLCLGLGLDFTIHVMHALREPGMTRERVAALGRSLAYCGLSTGLAFGALATGSNRGLITLGMTAMIGVLTVLITAAFALPWLWFRRQERATA
jgi:hypothetical protein